jgi:hypothetical protein
VVYRIGHSHQSYWSQPDAGQVKAQQSYPKDHLS